MGCTSSHVELSKEERILIALEDQLGYSHNSSKAVDLYHRKYSYGAEINQAQWRDITTYLNLKTENTPQNPKSQEFFQAFKRDKGNFSLKSLLTLGILVSSGTARDKAKLLFEISDSTDSKLLLKTDIISLVDEMVEISVSKLTLLFVTSLDVTQDDMKAYVKSLKESKDKAKPLIAKKIIGLDDGKNDAVSLKVFLSNFEDESTAKLTTPHGIREFVAAQKPNQKVMGRFGGLLAKKAEKNEGAKVEIQHATVGAEHNKDPDVKEPKEKKDEIKEAAAKVEIQHATVEVEHNKDADFKEIKEIKEKKEETKEVAAKLEIQHATAEVDHTENAEVNERKEEKEEKEHQEEETVA